MTVEEGKKRVKLSRSSAATTNLIRLTIGICILLLAILILIHQNLNATNGYLFRELERERTQLLREEETVKTTLANEQSLKALESSPEIQAMQKARQVQYKIGRAHV